MNSLQIKIPTFYGHRTFNFQAPDQFNVLSKKQLLEVVRLIFLSPPEPDKENSKANNEFECERKTIATKHLYKLKWWQVLLFTPAQMAYMNTFCTWLFDGEHFLTENKIDKISTGLFTKPLYGPIGDFETLTGKEWTNADSCFLEYCNTGEDEYLNDLIAILWRPINKDINPKSEDFKSDVRIAYNPHTVERRAKQVAKINPSIKFAILLWYRGCRQAWENQFERVFKGGTKEHVEHYGWAETIQTVSGKIFGNIRETEKTNMIEILLNMDIEIKNHDYWKEKNRNNNA